MRTRRHRGGPWSWLAGGAAVTAAPLSRPRTIPSAAPSSSIEAATGWVPPLVSLGHSSGRLNPFLVPETERTMVWGRDAAMTVPTISRARDLHASVASVLPITRWTSRWDPVAREPVLEAIAPLPWMDRPDPRRTRAWMLAWTVDDLFFHGFAYWLVTARYADNYPAAFHRMPVGDVNIDRNGTVRYLGQEVKAADVIEFASPVEGILVNGWRAVDHALRLDESAARFASNEVPAGWLKQTGGEPMSAAELSAMAEAFVTMRRTLAVAALNQSVDWNESELDPSRLQITEGREHQSLELARLCNVPAFLVGAPAGTSMTYLNGQQARRDLIDFGSLPYLACIEQTLSGPNVTPAGTVVQLDLEAWLRSAEAMTTTTTAQEAAQ